MTGSLEAKLEATPMLSETRGPSDAPIYPPLTLPSREHYLKGYYSAFYAEQMEGDEEGKKNRKARDGLPHPIS